MEGQAIKKAHPVPSEFLETHLNIFNELFADTDLKKMKKNMSFTKDCTFFDEDIL